jgi:Zn-dependent M28 family amino/carboxypeptidase
MTKHFSHLFSILILICYLFACSNPDDKVKNPAFEKIVGQISSDEIRNTISDLVNFETRWTHQKQLDVANYLYDRLRTYLDSIHFHQYEFWGANWKNVVGTIQGKKHPEQVVIVCAHLDSKSDKRLVYAPGADDNASGCAGVLELARILSKHSFQRTIRFIFFSREETDQQGSTAYLKSIDKDEEEIIAAINLDMIAYGSDNEDIDLVTRPEYAWLVDKMEDLARLYGYTTKKLVDNHCY